MSNSSQRPLLKRRPQLVATDISRLQALDQWTKQPAEASAILMGEGRAPIESESALEAPKTVEVSPAPAPEQIAAPEPVLERSPDPVPPPKPAAKQVAVKESSVTAVKLIEPPKHPWSDANPKMTVQYNMRMPSDLHAKLKWIGDTTYNDSMTQFVTRALQQAVAIALKQRGIEDA